MQECDVQAIVIGEALLQPHRLENLLTVKNYTNRFLAIGSLSKREEKTAFFFAHLAFRV